MYLHLELDALISPPAGCTLLDAVQPSKWAVLAGGAKHPVPRLLPKRATTT